MKTNETQGACDFYVRSGELHFQRMLLRHVQSELELTNEASPSHESEGASASVLCGCSEWVTESDPPITAGWDWAVTASGDVLLNRHSVRTNLMLVDENGNDLGHVVSIAAVVRRIEQLPWQHSALSALRELP